MSTFYLLPPRPVWEDLLVRQLHALVPGANVTAGQWSQLADLMTQTLLAGSDSFIVHREEIPEGATVAQALADGFGATVADEVVEIVPARQIGNMSSRRWQIGKAA